MSHWLPHDLQNDVLTVCRTFQPRGPVYRIKEFPKVKAALLLLCLDLQTQPHDIWNLSEKHPLGVVHDACGPTSEMLKSAEVSTAICPLFWAINTVC